MRKIIFVFAFLHISFLLFSKSVQTINWQSSTVWVDSIMNNLSIEEKIGQLLMVTAYPEQGESNDNKIKKWIEEQHVGGILFLRTHPSLIANQSNKYQSFSKLPLFIALDAENGLSFRLDSVVRYPYNMALGAIEADSLIYDMGREVGRQCKALGVNLNFAPVVDVNSNPNNPIINYRSFGEVPSNVAQKGWQLAKGIQDERVMVSAKHFPGHGDTSFDSHLTMPRIDKTYLELKNVDLLPFRVCIDSGICGIMSAHINMSGIDDSDYPATLSKRVMTDLLRDSLGFDGLVFSDGMNMKGITKLFNEGAAAVQALKSGVDVIEFVLNPEIVINAIKKALKSGELTQNIIDQKCRKVLLSKQWVGLDNYTPVKVEKLNNRLNNTQYKLTARKLYENCITVLKNNDDLIPFARLDTLHVATLAIGVDKNTIFQNRVSDYLNVDHYILDSNASVSEIDHVLDKLHNYNLILIGVHGTSLSARKNYGVTNFHKSIIKSIPMNARVVLNFFANPYSLSKYSGLNQSEAITVTYGDNYWVQDYTAQLLFGGIGANGTLPVSVNEKWRAGHGIKVKKNGRLGYSVPEELGIDSRKLTSVVDSFARYGIKEQIFPGCQVLLAKQGKVIYHQSFGTFTYKDTIRVQNHHIYDWASLTKITGPLPFIMKYVQDGVIKLDEPFSNQWDGFKHTDKEDITFREVLAHQAGLRPWLPFYLDILNKNSEYRRRYIRPRPSSNFPLRISSSLYIHKKYKARMLKEINELEIKNRGNYTYSGLAFYLFPEIISKISQEDYEILLGRCFLKPLGASSVCYNPYRHHRVGDCVPTEDDLFFRKELVQGFVHDEGAAMLGGVSGNAGLFGNTNDLAKIMQFYLNEGAYGDFNFLDPSTVNEFTRIQYKKNENRRGLGFDKPYIDNVNKKLKDAYPATLVSESSFGHSGFTGTFVWADPKYDLLFIFMSNRVYPSRENTKLFKLNFRPELQQEIYKCVDSFSITDY